MTWIQSLKYTHPHQWDILEHHWKRGVAFLQCPLAILGGAMTWVSDPYLVSAVSNEGGFGMLACGAMPPEMLRQNIQTTREKTSRPFGVNLILLHPEVESLIRVCIEEKISHVVFAGGLPSKKQIESLKKHDIRVIGFAPVLVLAQRLIKSGIDALIIEGSEAGGHVGPVSTSVLAQEILPEISEVPIFVAGGIGRGCAVAEYLRMGASGIQLGTLLVCSEESRAHPHFKNAFIKAQARDAVLSPQLDPRFPVIPVRALSNTGMDIFIVKQKEVIARFESGECSQKEGQLEIEHFWAGALRRAVIDGDIDKGSLMAGQSVGLVKEILPLAKIFQNLLTETLKAFE